MIQWDEITYEGEFSFSEMYGVPPNGVCHADDQLYLWNPWLLGPLSGDDVTGQSIIIALPQRKVGLYSAY